MALTNDFLQSSVIFLAAAVVAVPIAQRAGLGSVLGYLLAGVAIGPWGLGLISDVEAILHFSELGVVLLLFLIGLELNPKKLWQMRAPISWVGWRASVDHHFDHYRYRAFVWFKLANESRDRYGVGTIFNCDSFACYRGARARWQRGRAVRLCGVTFSRYRGHSNVGDVTPACW